MFKFKFWIWGTITLQLLTAVFHSLSFFVEPEPQNETEKVLMDLTRTYRPDAGLGFHPSFKDLFTGLSMGFTVAFLLAGLVNFYLLRKKISVDIWKGLLLIQTIVFGAFLIGLIFFTFIIPVACTGLIFLFLLGALLSNK